MKLSIVIPTNRIGGLDLLFESLERQSTCDFQLVLVDNIYRYRKDIVADMAKRYTFDFTHVPPRDDPFPKVAYCRTMNTGVTYAKHDFLLYECDYVWFSRLAVAKHLEYQAKHPCPLLADFAYTPLPALKSSFVPYVHEIGPEVDPIRHTESLNEVSQRYLADLESGKLKDLMWSIFEETPRSDKEVWDLGTTHTHYKNAGEGPFEDYNYSAFKNDSFPTELMLMMNGHDEEYDKSHCWQDSEFSYRLREMGIGWHNMARYEGEVRCLNPRHVLNIKVQEEPFGYNKTLCDDWRRADKRLPVNPEFDLRAMRDAILHGT